MYKKFLAAALAVTMVLGLAGCGGSGGSTQAASSQEKESSAAPAGSTGESTTAQAEGADAPAVIKVGFLTPLSGNNATYGAQCKAAGQMITEEGIVALTGQYTSAITKAVAVVTETYGIPLLTAGSSPSLTTPETGLEWYFRFGPNDTYYIRDSFEFIKQLNEEQDAGLMTVALVSEDTEFGANIRIEEERMAEEYGIEVVENITYSSSATNVSSEVMKIKAANPDVIMMSSYASDAILYLKTFKEQNYVPKMLLGQRGGFVQTDFLDAMGKDTEFIYTTGGWSADIDTDTSKQLIELYKQYTPDGADLSEGHCKDMINVLLIALGINQAGTTEPEALNEALRNLEVDTSTLPIPWNAITMDEYGQNTSANAFVLQMRDGKYQTVYPSDYAAIEPVLPMPAWNER